MSKYTNVRIDAHYIKEPVFQESPAVEVGLQSITEALGKPRERSPIPPGRPSSLDVIAEALGCVLCFLYHHGKVSLTFRNVF
jgi:hypothetical protein